VKLSAGSRFLLPSPKKGNHETLVYRLIIVSLLSYQAFFWILERDVEDCSCCALTNRTRHVLEERV
jgi:hypothetical protein